MHVSYFDVTVPVFKKNLLIAKDLLQKGLEHAREQGISEEMFLDQRLAPDMFPLSKQVQIILFELMLLPKVEPLTEKL